jgi:peptidyl-prolyl cis-trans isomerase C
VSAVPGLLHLFCVSGRYSKGACLCLGAALGLAPVPPAGAAGDEQVLVHGPGIVVTAADVRTEIAASPEPYHTRVTTDREVLGEAVNEVYRRKALVGAAQAKGLDQLPEVRAQVERARELILVSAAIDRQTQQLRDQIPDMTARAREIYQSKPERYLVPGQVRVRHILLRADSETARAARLPEAEALLKRLQEGADFADLARESSEDPGSAAAGGALPAFSRGRMVKPFEDAAFALQRPGDLSPVVASPFGLHIIWLEAIRPERQYTFDQVKDAIISKLRNDWLTEAVETWRQGIIDPAKAQVDPAALDAFMAEVIVARPAAPTPAPAGQ